MFAPFRRCVTCHLRHVVGIVPFTVASPSSRTYGTCAHPECFVRVSFRRMHSFPCVCHSVSIIRGSPGVAAKPQPLLSHPLSCAPFARNLNTVCITHSLFMCSRRAESANWEEDGTRTRRRPPALSSEVLNPEKRWAGFRGLREETRESCR